ncbi:MAG: tetratricopeptide repeat protein [bacterium]|nr:MAG: tetratricopeptide repeat protein [bacterium]
MRNLKTVTFLLFVLSLILWTPKLKAQEQEDFKIFNEAMELRIQREWDKALEKYEALKLKYPNSKYVDDAEFWSAYILEEQGKENGAFMAYQQMKNKYPNSPWADDATMHQISLAEKFVKQGQKGYKKFLTDNINSPHKNIKYQAALSLGKLGDKRAIPVLREMSNNGDKDMRSVGNSLLRKFERRPIQDRSQPRPMPNIPPKNRTDKKGDVIKQSHRVKPQIQKRTPTRKPDVKVTRPTPKRQPQRSTRPKTTAPKKKGKISQILDKNFPFDNDLKLSEPDHSFAFNSISVLKTS